MSDVATSAGYQPEFGQSPFAITRGLQFEGWLFKENAKVLHNALVKASMLRDSESGLLDLRLTMNGGPKLKSIDAAISESHKLLSNLSEKANFSPPSIIAGLALRIPKGVMLPEATLIIDAAIITKSEDQFSIKVGEIKVFPDRGGHTDPGEIATARAQAGVYQHALELTVKSLNLKNPPNVDTKGFLVFTWPGTNSPVIRPNEDLTFQALRANQGFERLDEIALRLVSEKAESDSASDSLAWSFCDLAARCQDLAIADDRAIILGREAARALGSVKVARAIELMDGATANTAFEVSLQTQLQSANWEALNT
jgi:hypothetical protein